MRWHGNLTVAEESEAIQGHCSCICTCRIAGAPRFLRAGTLLSLALVEVLLGVRTSGEKYITQRR